MCSSYYGYIEKPVEATRQVLMAISVSFNREVQFNGTRRRHAKWEICFSPNEMWFSLRYSLSIHTKAHVVTSVQTYRQTDRHTGKQPYIQAERQAHRRIYIQTY